MFLLKKIIAPFFMPLSAVLILVLAGLFCLWFTKKQKAGKILVTLSTLVLGFCGYTIVSDMVVRPLEAEHVPLTHFEDLKGVKWIVVLGGGSKVDPELPMSTYLSDASLFRLLEGVYVHNRIPGSKLVVTGRSAFEGITPVAEVMADVAEEWGVDPADIVVEDEAKDTKDHAVYVKEIVGGDRFILVTSASHMPRAMALFRNQGMDPIPAPTDYMVTPVKSVSLSLREFNGAREREGGLRPGVSFPSEGRWSRREGLFMSIWA